MRNAAEVNDRVDVVKQRTPIDRLREIGVLYHFDAPVKRRLRRSSHRGTNRMTVGGERRHHGTADEARCAGDEHALKGTRLLRCHDRR